MNKIKIKLYIFLVLAVLSFICYYILVYHNFDTLLKGGENVTPIVLGLLYTFLIVLISIYYAVLYLYKLKALKRK